jgi:hypothetical protein
MTTPPNILTATEAANALRAATTDPDMLALLPLVDAYIYRATGYDWTKDTTIRPEAKAAARMLIVQWHENPGMMAINQNVLPFGLLAALTQLEAIALQTRQFSFAARIDAGACECKGALVGDHVIALVGIIGATGDGHTSFESVITIQDQIQQTSASDLSANTYLVSLKAADILD